MSKIVKAAWLVPSPKLYHSWPESLRRLNCQLCPETRERPDYYPPDIDFAMESIMVLDGEQSVVVNAGWHKDRGVSITVVTHPVRESGELGSRVVRVLVEDGCKIDCPLS